MGKHLLKPKCLIDSPYAVLQDLSCDAWQRERLSSRKSIGTM